MIKFHSYSVNQKLLTNEVLTAYINNFWSDVFSPLNLPSVGPKYLMLLCKVEFNEIELGYRTLGHLRRVNFDDKDLFIEYLYLRLGVLTESYITHSLSKITFTYVVKDGLAIDNRRLLQDSIDNGITTHRFNNMSLPISMNPSDYGNIVVDNYVQSDGQSIHRFIVESGIRSYIIDVSSDGLVNKVRIQGAIDLQWMDTKISGDLFQREIGKSIIYFMGGEKVLRKKQLNAKPFTNLSVDTNLNSNFITMDIETIKVDSKLNPYLICAYNGIDYITSYANESLDQKALFNNFINQLFSFFTKDNTLTVYAHNLSGFDGIFLLRHLLPFGKVDPLIHNGKLMSIKVKLNVKGYKQKTLIFKDSYLLLPLSLRNLCAAFNISMGKGYFPFLLNDIFYKGILPKLEYWTGISIKEYELLLKEYTGIVWSFKQEAIKYCKLDCKCLHEILVKFNVLIYKEFKVNINHSLTLPALAMRIYKTQYMPKNTIYQLLGDVERDIRNSYTGGAVDVYIPHNRIENIFSRLFKKLYYYDVNSLYPTIMAKTPMPIGKPIAFEGDIRTIFPNAYGFFYCKITSPDNLLHPLLQRRIETTEGIRTIAGLGTWQGWVYSLEMDNAMKYGYQFEILNGYQFDKGFIFKDYIEKMYNLRLKFDKSNPMNLIAKLLMNSLYGKFGMKLDSTLFEVFDISSKEDLTIFKNMLDTYGDSIKDFIEIDNYVLSLRKSMVNLIYNED